MSWIVDTFNHYFPPEPLINMHGEQPHFAGIMAMMWGFWISASVFPVYAAGHFTLLAPVRALLDPPARLSRLAYPLLALAAYAFGMSAMYRFGYRLYFEEPVGLTYIPALLAIPLCSALLSCAIYYRPGVLRHADIDQVFSRIRVMKLNARRAMNGQNPT